MRRAAALVLAAVLCGCGVQPQDDAEQVPAEQLPTELRAGPSADGTSTEVDVYLVEQGRLVRHAQPAAGDDPVSALRSLLAAPAPQATRRTAVPAGTRVVSVSVDGDLAAVALSGEFGDVRGRDQLLAVAQVVWTLTESGELRRVQLSVAGRELPLPVDSGAAVDGPVTRAQYASVGPQS